MMCSKQHYHFIAEFDTEFMLEHSNNYALATSFIANYGTAQF